MWLYNACISVWKLQNSWGQLMHRSCQVWARQTPMPQWIGKIFFLQKSLKNSVFFDFGSDYSSQHWETPLLIHLNIRAHGSLILKSKHAKWWRVTQVAPVTSANTGKYGVHIKVCPVKNGYRTVKVRPVKNGLKSILQDSIGLVTKTLSLTKNQQTVINMIYFYH